MELHINQIKFDNPNNDRWATQFNLCSELFQRASDESLSKEERLKAHNEWWEERQKLETGNY